MNTYKPLETKKNMMDDAVKLVIRIREEIEKTHLGDCQGLNDLNELKNAENLAATTEKDLKEAEATMKRIKEGGFSLYSTHVLWIHRTCGYDLMVRGAQEELIFLAQILVQDPGYFEEDMFDCHNKHLHTKVRVASYIPPNFYRSLTEVSFKEAYDTVIDEARV